MPNPVDAPPRRPQLSRRAANIYASGPLDRVDHRRGDEAWIAAHLDDDATRFVPVWRARSLVAVGYAQGPGADPGANQGAPPRDAEAVWLDRQGAAPLLERAAGFIFLGLVESRAYVAVDLSELDEEEAERLTGEPGRFRDLREIGPLLGRDEGAVLAYARGLTHWHQRHRFCGVCGRPTESERAGHVRRCTNRDCGASHFPRTDPAVIMLVHDGGDRCVLGRQKIWLPGMHSTLAGFVEPGESLEDAVAREVAEEVGLKLADIEYHSSQPWPFPASIMLGFHARARTELPGGEDLKVNLDELEGAAWYSRDQLLNSPEDDSFRLPRLDSIARRLIRNWLGQEA